MTPLGLKTINGHAYLDLEKYVDLTSFDKLQADIYRGFALAKHLAAEGSLDVPPHMVNDQAHNYRFKPLFKAYSEFLELPDSDPIKIVGLEIQQKHTESEFITFLKHAMGGYDLYSFYVLCDFFEGWRNDPIVRIRDEVAAYFPGLKDWIINLQTTGIFSHIGRVSFFVLEAGGIAFEHQDPAVDPEYPNITSEFIHIRPNLERPFYVRSNITREKVYINTRVGYWNDQDWHGGEPVMKPSYSLRIDGIFTPELKNQLKI